MLLLNKYGRKEKAKMIIIIETILYFGQDQTFSFAISLIKESNYKQNSSQPTSSCQSTLMEFSGAAHS